MDPFFREVQGAAVVKHAVLSNQAGVFARKTGVTGRRVHLFDGYAGPGQYDDGTAASPQLLIETARALSHVREVRCTFVEQNRWNFERLARLIENEGDVPTPPVAIHGDVRGVLTDLLSQMTGEPLLAFLDPYGLAVPFKTLTSHLMNRIESHPRGARPTPTDIILNFSVNGLNRAAGRLEEHYRNPTVERGRETRLSNLDEFLGGSWWEEYWLQREDIRVGLIVREYARRVCASQPGWRSLTVPVHDTYGSTSPAYYLVLFTRSVHGVWAFVDGASQGSEKLHGWTVDRSGQPWLGDPADMGNWEGIIEQNLQRLLAATGVVDVGEQAAQVFGDTLGLARTKHLRSTLRRMASDGQIMELPRSIEPRRLRIRARTQPALSLVNARPASQRAPRAPVEEPTNRAGEQLGFDFAAQEEPPGAHHGSAS